MEKNLKLLGALLVAVAVVFATGCDSSGESSSSSLAGTTWEDEDGDTYYFASGGTFTLDSVYTRLR